LGAQIGIVLANLSAIEDLSDDRTRLAQVNQYYRRNEEFEEMARIAESNQMKTVWSLVERSASCTDSVLLCGETGVCKESIAREIHENGERHDGPFVVVRTSSFGSFPAFGEQLGQKRRALSGATEQYWGAFQLAERGTLFLDEVGELALEEQASLLRVLENGTFGQMGGPKELHADFRLIAATSRNLDTEVKCGRFRQDLLSRLQMLVIRIPPLRERLADIPLLAERFLKSYSRRSCKTFSGIGDVDIGRLVSYSWPGNDQELENVVARSVLLSEPPVLRIVGVEPRGSSDRNRGKNREWVSLEECERRYLREVLRYTAGKLTGEDGAASILGLKPSTLHFRIDKLGLRDDLVAARGGGKVPKSER